MQHPNPNGAYMAYASCEESVADPTSESKHLSLYDHCMSNLHFDICKRSENAIKSNEFAFAANTQVLKYEEMAIEGRKMPFFTYEKSLDRTGKAA